MYRVLVGKPEGKRPLGRPRRRWVDNIRMNLQEVGYGYMDWIGLAQVRDSWRKLIIGFFIDIKSFRSHYGPGVNSASNRNEYQEHFLGVKAAGA